MSPRDHSPAPPAAAIGRHSTYPRSLEGKVALVVGGAGAIGAETSRMLKAAGAKVVIGHLAAEKDTAAAAALVAELGEGHAAFVADVVDTASLILLRDAIAARYGR
ncbi:MAG: SDR family NAD(P)-dependent oxidoreductase, partial [Rhizobiales bacterium]|nr:SDR family NAD(P)-dependent oxidoreductase [Hyphomicrobiales bacterium]